MISQPHPKTSHASWYMKHPPICPQNTSSHSFVAVCLFGIPGVIDTKAGTFKQDETAFVNNVANHIQFLRQANMNVFFHAWQHPAHENGCFLRTKPYGDCLKNSQCDHLITSEHIHSMLISMNRVLLMNRDYEQKNHMVHDNVILMRHATKFCAPFSSTFNSMSLVISSILTEHGEPLDGILDYIFVSSSILLEYVIGTLLHRIQNKETVHKNMRAHFVMQSHFDDLFLSERGIVRSYNFSNSMWRSACTVFQNELCQISS